MIYNYLLSAFSEHASAEGFKEKKRKKLKKKKKSFKEDKEISKRSRLLWLQLTILAFAKCNEYCFFFFLWYSERGLSKLSYIITSLCIVVHSCSFSAGRPASWGTGRRWNGDGLVST